MTKDEIYKASDVLNTILDNYLHSGEAAEVVTKFEDELIKSNLTKEDAVSEELEDAARKYADNEEDGDDVYFTIKGSFKAGAKWQKEKDEEEKVLIYKHGFDDYKEQMMAKAVDGVARPYDNEIWCILDSFNLKAGDKVKVIVIKED